MGISAFLVLPMAKENDKVELRLVEEDAESDMGYARLGKDKEEKMDAELLVAALEGTVRDFFGSGSVEEMLRHVRHPERVAPLMERHYAGKAPVPTRVVDMLSLVPVTIDKKATFWMASCDLEESQRMQLALEVYPDQQVKVDSDTHDCYQLTALHGEEALFGYVIRDSALASRIAELVAGRNGLSLPVILRLHLPNGLDSPRGVVIRELVCPRWLFVEDPGITEP